MHVDSTALKDYINRVPNNAEVKIEVSDTTVTFDTEWTKNAVVYRRVQCYNADGTFSTMSIESNNRDAHENPFQIPDHEIAETEVVEEIPSN